MVELLEWPKREIMCPEDLEKFLSSPIYESYMKFITKLNSAVSGKALAAVPFPQCDDCASPQEIIESFLTRSKTTKRNFIERMEDLLITLMFLVKAFPAESHEGRFGNPQFRVWIDFVRSHATQLLDQVIVTNDRDEKVKKSKHYNDDDDDDEVDDEVDDDKMERNSLLEHLMVYLMSSFGNRQRIDYGTGNETLFMAFLYICGQLGLYCMNEDADEDGKNNDLEDIVLVVFRRYLQLMRLLQFTYWLEPAGSHGVWGLDDYHFLPFLFGSAQLSGHRHIKPKSIHDSDVVEAYASRYFYLGSIKFVNDVKNASLKWHSPMLDDISGVKSWAKINQGMLKMYHGDVMSKYPIMQHFLFGKFIPYKSIIVPIDIKEQEQQEKEQEQEKVNAFGDNEILKSSYPSFLDQRTKYAFEETHEEVCDHRIPGELPSCCGIKVPSAIGGARLSLQQASSVFRDYRKSEFTLPFD